jgi:hypothetical protein
MAPHRQPWYSADVFRWMVESDEYRRMVHFEFGRKLGVAIHGVVSSAPHDRDEGLCTSNLTSCPPSFTQGMRIWYGRRSLGRYSLSTDIMNIASIAVLGSRIK